MNNRRLTHDEVKEVVSTYFTQRGFAVDTECDIQFGTKKGGTTDVVVKQAEGYWAAIVECKSGRIRKTLEGEDQLKSYLSATDTRFGVIAASRDPADWIYFENLRSNIFMERDRSYFHARINDSPYVDRPDYDAINQLKIENEELETDNNQLQNDYSQLETDNNQLEQKIKNRTIVLSISALLAIAACLLIYFLILLPMHTDTRYQVIRIIDGDTVEIKYKGKLTSVQLFGVNAPETDKHPSKPPEPYGEEADKYLQELLLDKAIYLRFDDPMWDQYDRIRGYVFRASDGIFVNLEMIREGFAEVDLRYSFKHEELFMDYESRAKVDRKGMWSGY